MKRWWLLWASCAATIGFADAAPSWLGDRGKLLATGGVSQLEGAGGGGVVPWALMTSYGSKDSYGVNAHYTHVYLSDFTLRSAGAAIGIRDRVEVSYARFWFDTREAGQRLGLGEGFTFTQDIYGAKFRVIGDAVYDQDSWLPQISVGVQHKATGDGALLNALGAPRDDDTDFYVAATKLWLKRSVLLNGVVRLTRANQFGLLGYGGPENDDYRAQFEGSAALLVRRDLALGGEFRMKPDNLAFAEEGDAFTVFGAWFPLKHVSLTAAYADLGPIALQGDQRGIYLSLQLGF